MTETSGFGPRAAGSLSARVGDVHLFAISPDGKAVAFTRGPLYGQGDLWAIDRDGGGLRQLLSAPTLHDIMGPPTNTMHTYADEVSFIGWPEGDKLGIEIYRSYDAIGGCCESGGHWKLDVNMNCPLPSADHRTRDSSVPDGSRARPLRIPLT
jgi:hypothetical protein